VSVDLANNTLYMAYLDAPTGVRTANLDGTGLADFNSEGGQTAKVAPGADLLLWPDGSAGFRKAPLDDGSDLTTLLDEDSLTWRACDIIPATN
jgi:hypothetical protein